MFRLLPLAATLLITSLAAHAQDASAEQPPKVPAEALAAADRLNRLGVSLFTAAGKVRQGNLVTSPWPTYRSLSLALIGAGGKTRQEIAELLGTENPVGDQQHLLRAIDPEIAAWNRWAAQPRRGEKVDQIAWASVSAVWADARTAVLPNYVAATRSMHGTLVRGIDFRNPGKAVVDINTWISQATGGRIPRLLAPGAFNDDSRLALSSATFFKAPWRLGSAFKVADTRMQPFRINGGTEKVFTMAQRSEIGSAVHEDFTVLGLPTAAEFQLLIFVPRETASLALLEDRLTPELLRACAPMKSSRIELHLPRFRVAATTLMLRQPLEALGMRAAFDREVADFTLMSRDRLFLDDVFDAAEFRVDENGLSGAGATVSESSGLGGNTSTLPADSVFRVDRPFLFALQHIGTGACIFFGRVTDPR